MYKINGIDYELLQNIKDGFNLEDVIGKYTDYFEKYDFIFGDWAYGKLRLKGFYENNNKNVKDLNNINNLDKHIEENCAFECRYFLLKKVSNTVE